MKIGDVSFWYGDIGMPYRRAPLSGDATADVAIIGAGYSGLWAAYYLKRANPGLDVLVLEKEFAGFGASGRNGGLADGRLCLEPCALSAQSLGTRRPRDGRGDERHGG